MFPWSVTLLLVCHYNNCLVIYLFWLFFYLCSPLSSSPWICRCCHYHHCTCYPSSLSHCLRQRYYRLTKVICLSFHTSWQKSLVCILLFTTQSTHSWSCCHYILLQIYSFPMGGVISGFSQTLNSLFWNQVPNKADVLKCFTCFYFHGFVASTRPKWAKIKSNGIQVLTDSQYNIW